MGSDKTGRWEGYFVLILVVDDEENIRTLIRKYAQREGFDVLEAKDGVDAVQKVNSERPDLVVMDVMMPKMDGFSALREIRETSQVPVIMLSARGEEYDRLNGFVSGADDYVIKPFSPRELVMRMDAVLRRCYPESAPHKIYENDGLKVDFTARSVHIDDNTVTLSPKEYDLLVYFIENQSIALSREKLLTQIWGYDYEGDERTLDTHVKTLRKALGEYSKQIVTLRGVGYRFDP